MLTRLRQLLDNKWLARFRQDRSIREAFFVFLLTRSLIFVVIICVGHVQVTTHFDPVRNFHDAYISLQGAQIARHLRKTLWQGDAGHYLDISENGYYNAPFDVNNRRSQQFAFFPLLPMLFWVLRQVTNDVTLWGAALCNVFFFCALVFLYRLTLAFGYDDSVARRAIFYLAAFPISYFFSVPMTESLFVFLTVASFYAARRERWWIAGVIGLFASATRLTGLMLLPALVVLSWQMYRSLQVRKILGLLLIPFGLFAYMFYSWWLSGDALAFKHAAAAWGHNPSIFFLSSITKWLIYPHPLAAPWNVYLFHVGAALLCLVCIFLLARRREWALALYTFLSILLPLSSGLLQSMERYTMGFFPMFIALAVVARSEHSDQTIRFFFLFMLGMMTTLYAASITNAFA